MDHAANMSATTEAQSFQSPPGLEAFSGAHHFNVNDLRFTQIQNQHNSNKFVIYKSSGKPIDLPLLLNPITDASHKRNKKLAPPNSYCLPGTRQQVMDEVRTWAKIPLLPSPSFDQEPPDLKSICWVYGYVGCGKSAVAQNIAEEFAAKDKLAASFFFFRNAGDRSNMNRLAATLAHQISQNVPGAKALIEQAIMEDPGVVEPICSLDAQLEHLVFKPCLGALGASASSEDGEPYLIVVDGLDECGDKDGAQVFIDQSIAFLSRYPSIRLRLLITSRIEEHIRTHLEDASTCIYMMDLVSRSSREDVEALVKITFANAKKHDRALQACGEEWPEKRDTDQLVDYCDGSFIFGSTLLKFILIGSGERDPRTPMERLPLALKINPGLDGVYMEVLSRAQHLPHFLLVISTVAMAEEPLSILTMSALLDISTYEIIRILVNLQAILQVPGTDDVPVTLFHTSLRDFLVDESRSGPFHTSPSHHVFLVKRSLSALFGPRLSSSGECCRYALMYWAKHLQLLHESGISFDLDVNAPYSPVRKHEKDDFVSRWAASRPVKARLSQEDWAIMVRNSKWTWNLVGDGFLGSEILRYFHRGLQSDNWNVVRTPGWGRSCPPIVKVENLSSVGSIRDILQGFCHLLSDLNQDSWGLHLSMKRGDGLFVNVDFVRTDPERQDREERPGGSFVTFRKELGNDLYLTIRG